MRQKMDAPSRGDTDAALFCILRDNPGHTFIGIEAIFIWLRNLVFICLSVLVDVPLFEKRAPATTPKSPTSSPSRNPSPVSHFYHDLWIPTGIFLACTEEKIDVLAFAIQHLEGVSEVGGS